ncbi:hypothetical protein BKA22_002338 [Cellulomonas soli]|nr:hypothetical protein [Cellulomonas soli]
MTVPSGVIHAHVASVRRRNPEANPAQVVALLEREYLRVVAGTGGAVGAAAAAPAVGTGVATALTISDVATFFAASASFSLAVASVHGIQVDDVPRRTTLLLATILGESGVRMVGDSAQISAVHVGRAMLTRMPTGTIRAVNTTLTRRLVRTQATRHGGLALGRLAPFGIGAVIGLTGGRALGRTVVAGARAAFGPAPASFPAELEVVGPGGVARLERAPGPESAGTTAIREITEGPHRR